MASREGYIILSTTIHGLFFEMVALQERWPLVRVATYGGPLDMVATKNDGYSCVGCKVNFVYGKD